MKNVPPVAARPNWLAVDSQLVDSSDMSATGCADTVDWGLEDMVAMVELDRRNAVGKRGVVVVDPVD